MAVAIGADRLVKTYGRTRALDGLTFAVEEGQVHGFLGPNGAGKTTTLRILLGMARATSGKARLLGGDPWRDAVALHRRLAYVPGDVALWPNLSGGEVIDLLGRMRGGLDEKKRAALLERFDLDPTKKGRAYSKGNRQKVALVAALASDVELLLLDEPTSGLDPLMEAAFRDCLAEERAAGRTVLLSSHILAEVEAVCDHVTIIRAGRVVETGALAVLRHLAGFSITAELAAAPTGIADLPGVSDLRVEDHTLRCRVESAHLSELVNRLGAVGIKSLVSQPPTLEDLFLRYYGEAPGAHGETPGPHGETPGPDGETPGPDGETPGRHGQAPPGGGGGASPAAGDETATGA